MSSDVPMLPPPLYYLDSDSKHVVDFNAIDKVLSHIKATRWLPDGYDSGFQNKIMTIEEGQSRVRHTDAIDVETLHEKLEQLLRDTRDASVASTEQQRRPRPVILDSFLLYHDPEIRNRLDLMLSLRLSKVTAKARRLAKPKIGEARMEQRCPA